jgi:hypothetical protein
MDCPFCGEAVKDDALVCKTCSRDLRLVRPVMTEVRELVIRLEKLRRDLDRVNAALYRARAPLRYFAVAALLYVVIPTVLLVAAHIVVTIVLNVSPLYLRIASFIIPLPFGLGSHIFHKVGIRGALFTGIVTAALAVLCMLTVTGVNDSVPILPASWLEWREVMEYSASIALAFGTGNILGILLLQTLHNSMIQVSKPNPAAYRLARLLGQHVGEEQLRRRAKVIQDLMRTAGPLAGAAGTAIGSVYAGLKGIVGS